MTRQADGATEQRRLRRSKVFVVAQIEQSGETQRAHVLDISAAGARLHTTTPSLVGASVAVTIGGRTGAADVVWSDQQRCGVQFVHRLHEDHLSKVIDRR